MAMGPKELGAAFTGFFDANVFATLFRWFGYIVISVLILGALVAIYFYFQYKYKVYYPRLHYSPDGMSAQIIGWKRDRARTITKKEGTVKQHLLFMNTKLQKFKEEDIIPRNKVFMLKVNKKSGTYIPMPTVTFGNTIANFETLSPEKHHWGILQIKEIAATYADLDIQKRAYTYMVVVIVLCLACCAFVAWIIMKQPAKMADIASTLGDQMAAWAEGMRGTPPG